MKPRRLIVTLEVETDAMVAVIKDWMRDTWSEELKQVQVNVVRERKPAARKRARK